MTKLREDLKDDYAKLGGGRGRRGGGGGGGADVSQEERAAARKKVNEAEDKALKGVLDDKQMKRLEQIHVQQEGLAAFTQNEDVQKALKLSDDQKDKIKTINEDMRKQMQELRGGGGGGGRGFNPEMRQKMQGLQKEATQNAVKVLNDSQKKTYEELTGKPFDYKPDQQGGKPRTDF
jgi:hypothetical protein